MVMYFKKIKFLVVYNWNNILNQDGEVFIQVWAYFLVEQCIWFFFIGIYIELDYWDIIYCWVLESYIFELYLNDLIYE